MKLIFKSSKTMRTQEAEFHTTTIFQKGETPTPGSPIVSFKLASAKHFDWLLRGIFAVIARVALGRTVQRPRKAASRKMAAAIAPRALRPA
jgi:hypothetical protein